ncbi:MAG: FtsW/RodA/SpoVE family cell cycle protein [Aggregatilineales bacterium]
MTTITANANAAQHAARARTWRNFDFILLGATLILIVYGVLMIRSATIGAIDPNISNRVERQIEYAVVGLVILLVTAAIDYRLLGSMNRYIYLFLIGLLFLVWLLGKVGGAGAQRWLTVGIPIQPSEIAKILLIVVLAEHLQHQYQKLNKLRTVLLSFGYVGLPAFFIFIQPNLSITILVIVTWFVMVWAAGLRLLHIGLFLLIIAIVLPIIWSQMADYQRGRIFSFLNCSGNTDTCYNINQAAISIGSGGAFGEGYANGTQTQLRFLRVRWTDFIFAVIGNELGFVGSVLVLILIGIVLWRIMRAAYLARDPLGSLICYGVATHVFFQTVVSVGMNLQLIPVTGLTLPFISSGGSSLLALLFGLGLVESVIMRHKQIAF